MPVRDLNDNDVSAELATTLLLSSHIRNSMEDIHDFISDELMAILNAEIRYAIYEFFTKAANNVEHVDWLTRTLPRYWEVPGIDP